MEATDLTGAHDVLENAVCLEEQVFACLEAYGIARKGVDKFEVGKMSVEKFRYGGKHLAGGRLLDKDCMEHPVLRVGLRVLPYASAGVGTVAYIHRKEQVANKHLTIDNELDTGGLMHTDGGKQGKEIIDMVAADVVLERGRPRTTECIHPKAHGIEKITMVCDAVAPIGNTSDINGTTLTVEEMVERTLVVLGQPPIAGVVVARAARHDTDSDTLTLLGRDIGTHNAIDRFGECTIPTQDENLVVAPLGEFTPEFDSMPRILCHPIGKRLMPLPEEFPKVDALHTKGAFARLGIDDDS